jgi:hypothetical protein
LEKESSGMIAFASAAFIPLQTKTSPVEGILHQTGCCPDVPPLMIGGGLALSSLFLICNIF